jgi:hypothetical protein
MLALRTSDGLALHHVGESKGVVDDLVANDLAHISGNRLVLTDRGYLVLNEIVLRLSGGDGGRRPTTTNSAEGCDTS